MFIVDICIDMLTWDSSWIVLLRYKIYIVICDMYINKDFLCIEVYVAVRYVIFDGHIRQ